MNNITHMAETMETMRDPSQIFEFMQVWKLR